MGVLDEFFNLSGGEGLAAVLQKFTIHHDHRIGVLGETAVSLNQSPEPLGRACWAASGAGGFENRQGDTLHPRPGPDQEWVARNASQSGFTGGIPGFLDGSFAICQGGRSMARLLLQGALKDQFHGGQHQRKGNLIAVPPQHALKIPRETEA